MSVGASQDGLKPESEEQARADVYRLLGALLAGPPTAALLGMLRNITPAADAVLEMPMTTAWQQLKVAAEQVTPDRIEEEYFNLFIGMGRGELVPYASYYVHGLLMEKTLAALRSELGELGITRRNGVAEPEDHVAAICEIMGMNISGHRLHLRQKAFFDSYIDPWMGRFFDDLGAAESADFYRSVALLGQQFLTVERQYFSLPA